MRISPSSRNRRIVARHDRGTKRAVASKVGVVYTTLLSIVCVKYSTHKRRFVADLSHVPPSEYSPRPNGDALRKCILQGPYIPYTVIIQVVPATYDSQEVLEQIAVETLLNMSPENKEHYQSEKDATHFLLTGIGDEIYSTVDACKTAHDM
ncbi:hypothetical protein Tco_1306367 [Tanacetum coccineum]